MSRPKQGVVYGLNACLAAAAARPEALRRIFYHRSHRVVLGPLLKAAAALRRPYREVPAEDLERLSGSAHHEGVVLFTDPLPLLEVPALLTRVGPAPLLVALDKVGNPHNLGAILRSAAWFGADGLLFRAQPGQGTLNGATLRVAQGGAEQVALCGVADLGAALRAVAAAGIAVIGADQAAPEALGAAPLRRPVCLVLGAEGEGLSPEARGALSGVVRIPGSGRVESLNVAVAAGILLSHVAP